MRRDRAYLGVMMMASPMRPCSSAAAWSMSPMLGCTMSAHQSPPRRTFVQAFMCDIEPFRDVFKTLNCTAEKVSLQKRALMRKALEKSIVISSGPSLTLGVPSGGPSYTRWCNPRFQWQRKCAPMCHPGLNMPGNVRHSGHLAWEGKTGGFPAGGLVAVGEQSKIWS